MDDLSVNNVVDLTADAGPVFGLKPVTELLIEMKGADWLIKPYLERATAINLFGESGTFKSFVLIDMACCVASGMNYHGRKVAQGPVVLLVGEGHSGIARRVAVWRMAHNVTSELAILVSEVPAELMSNGMNGALSVADAIEAECNRQFGAPPVLIGIDTISANFGDGDISSNADVSKAVRQINIHLRDRFDAAVILVMHVGHGDKNRELGAYALRGNVDTRIMVKKTATGCSLHSEKVKDGAPFEPIQFKASHCYIPNLFDSEGEAQGSLILEEIDYKPVSEVGADFLTGKKRQLFDVIEELYRRHDGDLTRKAVLGECLKRQIFKNSNSFGNAYREMAATGHILEYNGFIRAREV